MSFVSNIVNSKLVERTKRKFLLMTKIYLKVKKLSPSVSEDMRVVRILNEFGFTKVLDIGANTGQFAEALIDFGYQNKIVSFEPTSEAYGILSERAKSYSNWEIADKMAVGNTDGEIEINVSSNTVFNSIKKISTDYSDYNNEAAQVSVEKVPIKTLNTLKGQYFDSNDKVLLKIDTQGFEKEVLEGAEGCLNLFDGIKMEVPLIPIYEGVEFKIDEIIPFMKEKGFTCVSLHEVAVNQKIGVVHEVDAVFLRNELVKSKIESFK